jgi:hypothetical protein
MKSRGAEQTQVIRSRRRRAGRLFKELWNTFRGDFQGLLRNRE